MIPRRIASRRGVEVLTEMPGATGVVQEAGNPPRPSTSTRQSRQEPKALMLSLAQSFGIAIPISIAARMIEVPSGTVTPRPSIVSATDFSERTDGVPKSVSLISVIPSFPHWRRLRQLASATLGVLYILRLRHAHRFIID